MASIADTKRALDARHAILVIISSLAVSCAPGRAVVGLERGNDEGAGGSGGATFDLSPMLADWPRLAIGTESRSISSFDRAGGNDDGFSGRYSELYTDEKGEHVIVDVGGPGRLNTLWFTSAVSGTAPLGLGRLRFYVDGATTPTFEADADRLFAGQVAGFPRALVFDNRRSTGGFVSYVPVTFRFGLRVTTENKPAFYNAQIDSLPADAVVESWSPDADLTNALASFGAGSTTSGDEPSDDEVTLDNERDGPGLVTRLTFFPSGSPSAAELRAARVRIFWENEAHPSVDGPVDAFFGSGLGVAPVASAAFEMSPARFVNRVPMPFWRHARVQLTGVAGRLFLHVVENPYDESHTAHLHVTWHEERPTTSPDDFEYVTFTGAGKLVATVLTVEPPDAARDKQWWEGDLRSSADGRRTPGIQGTGYEDDHFGGWSNEFFSTPFSLPLSGEPAAHILDRNGQYNGDVTMYRVWPGIPFLGELRHSVEHGDQNGRAVNESAATFFYGEPRSWLVTSDTLDLCDADARTAHGFMPFGQTRLDTLTSRFEGRDPTPITHCHLAQSNTVTFKLAVPATNEGVYLRRWFDQATGPQAAVVSVDGEFVEVWSIAETNASANWAERDFSCRKASRRAKRRSK